MSDGKNEPNNELGQDDLAGVSGGVDGNRAPGPESTEASVDQQKPSGIKAGIPK